MMRCQICGRRKGMKRNGEIVMHHVNGDRCTGTGHPPIEYSHGALELEIARLRAEAKVYREMIAAKEAARANWINPRYLAQAFELDDRAAKLARRLKRHLDWPQRFARQMERHGYGDPPPAYLREMVQ